MTKKKAKNGSAGPTIYPYYRHTGQDPVVDLMKKLRESSPMTDEQIRKRNGLSASTSKNWFSKKTRRPQHSTLAAYAGAFGKRFVLEDSNTTEPVIRRKR